MNYHNSGRTFRDKEFMETRECLSEVFMDVLGLQPEDIEEAETFKELGISSINTVELLEAINTKFELNLPTSIVFAFNTLDVLAEHINNIMIENKKATSTLKSRETRFVVEDAGDSRSEVNIHKDSLKETRNPYLILETDNQNMSDDIAVIGLSCRCAGADGQDELWDIISNGKDCIQEIQNENWLAYIRAKDPDKKPIYYGAMKGVEFFDSLFFNISPNEAEAMDVTQRVLLEECYKALEDAGYTKSYLKGRQVGTIIGTMGITPTSNDFSHFSLLGSDTSILAARIAYHLDLRGAALVVNTACSSSLVAIDLACQKLKQHEIDLAIAGGITIYTYPGAFLSMHNAGMLSPAGECHPFDNEAQGIVVGDGVGVVILKRLKDAERDKDCIYGIIRGSGTNQDGQTSGITAPNFQAQSQLEESVYTKNHINVEDIQYIEAHGTGTKLGDPIEVHALTHAFRKFTEKKRYCSIGSLKANIGHTTAAAGVLSLIKVLLSFKHKQLPPTIHFNKENEHIDFTNSPFFVNTTLREWLVNQKGRRLAAVSSFGFGGTNAHLVLEDYPESIGKEDLSVLRLLVLSAENGEGLQTYAKNVVDYIKAHEEVCIEELMYTFQIARESMTCRLAIAADNKELLLEKLQQYAENPAISSSGIYSGKLSKKEGIDISDTQEGKDFIASLARNGRLRKIAELWVNGSQIDWHALYQNESFRRLSGLPTYPFAKEQYKISEYFVSEKIDKPSQIKNHSSSEGQSGITSAKEADNNGLTAAGASSEVISELAVQSDLKKMLAKILGVQEDKLEIDQNISRYGLDSITAMNLTNNINQKYKLHMSIVDIFDHDTIMSLAQYLAPNMGQGDDFADMEQSIKPADITIDGTIRFPLSAGQFGLWLTMQKNPDAHNYNIPMAFHIKQKLNKNILREAFEDLVRRHPILLAKIKFEDQMPVNIIDPSEKIYFEFENISQYFGEELKEYLLEKASKPFKLENGPLMRINLLSISENEHILLVTVHHIVFDGSSGIVFVRDLIELYEAKCSGRKEKHNLNKSTYSDFVKWQSELLNSEEGDLHKQYWKTKLSGELPALNLPVDNKRKDSLDFKENMYIKGIPANLMDKVNKICIEEKVSAFVFMLSVFKSLLHRYTKQEDILVWSVVGERPSAEFENLIGYFINTILIRSTVHGDMPFCNLLKEVRKNTLEALEHGCYPFEAVKEKGSKLRDNSSNIQVAFVLQNWFKSKEQFVTTDKTKDNQDILKLESIQDIRQEGMFDLQLEIMKAGGNYNIYVRYNSCLFEQKTISRMMTHYLKLMEAILDDCNKIVDNINFIQEEEKDYLISEWNEPKAGYPNTVCIHQLFEEQVRKTPEKTAIVFDEQRVSYSRLNSRANQLARVLRNSGVKPDSIVGILADRSVEMIVGILAVLKAGGAYLPIDPDYPQDRISYTLEDSGTDILLTQKHLSQKTAFSGNIICLDNAALYQGDCTDLNLVNTPDNLAYIIYTSGTTGRPKGAMVEHRNVVRLLFNDRMQFDFTNNDVWTMFHSVCFDFSVWEMYGALLYGGKLVLIPKCTAQDPKEYLKVLRKERVTILNETPSAFYNLSDQEMMYAEKELAVRYIIFGGEALKPIMLKPWRTKYPQTKLINMYGITETTVHVTFKEITEKDINLNVSNIGRPIPTLTTYIMDSNMQLVPYGMVGELCVGGEGVARGYLHNPELTLVKFVQNPYIPSEKLYRSGDLARLLPNGDMEYMGRIDNQVKIRGFRIEPGEIEAIISSFENIKDVRVSAYGQKDKSGNNRLKAYFIVKENSTVSIEALRNFLKERLPDYMIPASFEQVDKYPLTINGKIDFKTLSANNEKQPEKPVENIQAKLDINSTIISVFQEMLEIDKIDPNTNFFDLGGHSMLLLKVASKLSSELQREITPAEFLKHPTVNSLEQYLSNDNKKILFEGSKGRAKKQRDFFMRAAKALNNNSYSAEPEYNTQIKEQGKKGYPKEHTSLQDKKNFQELIAEQAEKNPNAVAIVAEGKEITYKVIEERADRLATILKENQVTNGSVVGIMTEQLTSVIIGAAAVKKAGGDYLLIDLSQTRKQVIELIKERNILLLLANEEVVDNWDYNCLQSSNYTGSVTPSLNPVRPQIKELDSIPIPDRSLIDYEKYSKFIGLAMGKNTVAIQGSRGCPYQCAYCHKIWPKTHIIRSAEHIFNEVSICYSVGIRRFAFIDDIFNLNRENSGKFFQMVIDAGMDIQIFFPNGVRGDILTEDYIDLMVKAGSVNIALALETASPRLQKLIGKNLDLNKFKKNIDYIAAKYPHVILEIFTMHGFPTETEEEALMTLNFIKSLKWVHFPYVHILKIYPNTDMATLALENGVSMEKIEESMNLAYHELPETLPFPKNFTRMYQAQYFVEYFLCKERLLKLLPFQMNILTEDELVQKYNSYLPTEVNSFDSLLEVLGISRTELGNAEFTVCDDWEAMDINNKIKKCFPEKKTGENPLKCLFLDLSQWFSDTNTTMLYNVVEPPLGHMYLLTYLNEKYQEKICGKIAKSRVDFNSYDELRTLIDEFKPDVIGIRTLSYYKDFFHKTIALIRQWGFKKTIVSGGPYATSSYESILLDSNIDIVSLGEGELTISELVGKIIANNGNLPNDDVLETIKGIAFVKNKRDLSMENFYRKIILINEFGAKYEGEGNGTSQEESGGYTLNQVVEHNLHKNDILQMIVDESK